MAKILLLHGPNLNLLGTREPEVYGAETLEDINQTMGKLADNNNIALDTRQSNSELELVQMIHQAKHDGVAFIIFNPAAFTHTSIVLRDALAAVQIPFVEVHLSNVHAREEFRRHSYFADLSVGTICGFGSLGYELALKAAIQFLEKP